MARTHTPIARLNDMDLSGMDLSDEADDYVLVEVELAAIDLGVDFSSDLDADVLEPTADPDLDVDLAIDLDPFEP